MHANVHLAALVLADAPDLALLQHPQQLDLHAGRDLADLVEQQGAPLAASNSPGGPWVAPVNAPRTCPNSSLSSSVSVMAPQLTAMNGPAVPRRLVVHEAGDALLAGPALTGDEHGRVDRSHPAREVDDLPHRALFAAMPSADPRPSCVTRVSARRCVRSFDSAALSVAVIRRSDPRGSPRGGRVEEPQLLGRDRRPSPRGCGPPVARGVALAQAPILEDEDLAAATGSGSRSSARRSSSTRRCSARPKCSRCCSAS
jgi:hypothetical protein